MLIDWFGGCLLCRTRILLPVFLLASGCPGLKAFSPPEERSIQVHSSIAPPFYIIADRSKWRLFSIIKNDDDDDYEDDDDDEECSIYNLDACLEEGKTEEECCIENLDGCLLPDDDGNQSLDQSLRRLVSMPIVEVTLSVLVLASSFLVGLGTLQSLPPIVADSAKNGEIIISAIFTIEYFIRWKLSGFSAKYVVQPLAIIDLIAIIPGLIKIVAMMGVAVPPSLTGGALINLRLLRILRLQRVLVDYETFSKFELALGLNPSDVRPFQLQLARIVISIFTLLSVTAGLIYSAEHVVNPAVSDYFTALYFTEITLTTVGYGDIAPVTTAGKWIVGGSILVGSAVIPAQAAALVEALLDRQDEQDEKAAGMNGDAASLDGDDKNTLLLPQNIKDLSSTSVLNRIERLEQKVDDTNARLDRVLTMLEKNAALEEEEIR